MTSSVTEGAPPALTIGERAVPAGSRLEFSVLVARSPIQSPIELPITVVHGARPGPRVFLTAAVHGDELNGLPIIWRTMRRLQPATLRGSVVAAPVANGFAVAAQSRYLPDRRDLNRAFPGSARGSLAGRLANMLMETVIRGSDVGVDLHTGSLMRSNLPQVRANLDDPETRALAEAFAAPVSLHGTERQGSLRRAATAAGVRCLLYEGGEGLRFDSKAVRVGVEGVQRLLGHLGMIPAPAPGSPTRRLGKSSWVRAPRSGMVELDVEAGDEVVGKARIGRIVDVFGRVVARLKAPFDGVVIGRANNPVVHRGDALVHIGRSLASGDDEAAVEAPR